MSLRASLTVAAVISIAIVRLGSSEGNPIFLGWRIGQLPSRLGSTGASRLPSVIALATNEEKGPWQRHRSTLIARRTPPRTRSCGRVCSEAFSAIAATHGLPPEIPSVEVATGLLTGLLSHPGFYSVVAEREGEIVGSNFLDERSKIAGVGPVTAQP